MAEHLKHTPVPWRPGTIIDVPGIRARPDIWIAMMAHGGSFNSQQDANRDFILRACNNHQKLLNLVDRFIDLVSVEDDADHKPEECDSCELMDDARRLIENLKGN